MAFLLKVLVLGLTLLTFNGMARASTVIVAAPNSVGFLLAGNIPEPVDVSVSLIVFADFPGNADFGTGYYVQAAVVASNTTGTMANETILIDYRIYGGPCCEFEMPSSTITISDTMREIIVIFQTVYEQNLPGFSAQVEVSLPEGITAVPEPSTWAMLLIGSAGIGFAGYLRRSPFARMFA